MHNRGYSLPTTQKRTRKCAVIFSFSFGILLLLLTFVEETYAFPIRNYPSLLNTRDQYSTSLHSSQDTGFQYAQSELLFDDSIEDDPRYTMSKAETVIEVGIGWAPAVVPILAFALYDPTAAVFAKLIDAIAQNNFVAVDGGQYQAKIIAPAINGVVVPAISILFANLIGTTITTLRQRQLDIRTTINLEAGQLRILQSLLEVLNNRDEQQVCCAYLAQYTSRLIAENQPTFQNPAINGSLDTELNGILRSLNRLACLSQDPRNVAVIPNPLVLDKAYQSCTKLYEERAKRVASLRSAFPTLHFVIVATLALSICVAFLLESNQDILMFLNAIQLRILWTMLVGTFSALAVVCYDLSNPFRGSYQISTSVDQLYTIRLALRAYLAELRPSSNE